MKKKTDCWLCFEMTLTDISWYSAILFPDNSVIMIITMKPISSTTLHSCFLAAVIKYVAKVMNRKEGRD